MSLLQSASRGGMVCDIDFIITTFCFCMVRSMRFFHLTFFLVGFVSVSVSISSCPSFFLSFTPCTRYWRERESNIYESMNYVRVLRIIWNKFRFRLQSRIHTLVAINAITIKIAIASDINLY